MVITIIFNIEERKKEADKFQKDFFNRVNTSVFGKMSENLTNHNVDQKLVSRSIVFSQKIFDEN